MNSLRKNETRFARKLPSITSNWRLSISFFSFCSVQEWMLCHQNISYPLLLFDI